jgi:hypothetical protein
MKGMDCFQFTVSNVICNSSYTFRSMSNTTSYPTGALANAQLCTVSVSPVVDTYICSTQQVVCTSIIPSAPFGVTTTPSNISWNTPITPENYGFPTITSYTISYGTVGVFNVSMSNITYISPNRLSLNITAPPGNQKSQISATNMAGTGPYSRPG